MKSYRFVNGLYRSELIVKKSRFIATVCGELDGDGVAAFINGIRKEFPDATHNCYAYISDVFGNETGYSDDGEPSQTAGLPIFNVLYKQGLRKSAAVITRYFGGVKLGTGGLTGAYSAATAAALKLCVISEKTECVKLSLYVSYSAYPQIEAYLNGVGAKDTAAEFSERVKAITFVPLDIKEKVIEKINAITNGAAEITIGATEFR